jgi:uncharacterized protein YjbI with pentapeptide repeats
MGEKLLLEKQLNIFVAIWLKNIIKRLKETDMIIYHYSNKKILWEDDSQTIKESVEKASLSRASLQGADLQGANLSRADLYGVNLQGADLQGANLSRADLQGANLYGVNLHGANLYGVNLSRANLHGANLYGVNLSRANISRADLQGANLYGVNLHGADLYGVNLSRANLSRADLQGANLYGVNLHGANLYGVNLSRANLYGANLYGADLQGVNLYGANLSRADLYGVNLQGADLQGAKGLNPYQITPLLILKDQPGKIRAYKLVNKDNYGPFYKKVKYELGKSYEVEDANISTEVQCGPGISLATLDWCIKEYKPGYKIFIAEFEAKDIASIPTNTDGKFRVHKCRIVGEKDLKEIGIKV